MEHMHPCLISMYAVYMHTLWMHGQKTHSYILLCKSRSRTLFGAYGEKIVYRHQEPNNITAEESCTREVVQKTAVFEIMLADKVIILFPSLVLVDQNIQLACIYMQVLLHIRTFSLISAMMKFVLHKLMTTHVPTVSVYTLAAQLQARVNTSTSMLHSTIRTTARYDHQIPCPCTQHACLD